MAAMKFAFVLLFVVSSTLSPCCVAGMRSGLVKPGSLSHMFTEHHSLHRSWNPSDYHEDEEEGFRAFPFHPSPSSSSLTLETLEFSSLQFPVNYTSNFTLTSGKSSASLTLYVSATADVMRQDLQISSDDISENILDFATKQNFTMLMKSGRNRYCSYVDLTGTVNNTLFYPDVTSSVSSPSIPSIVVGGRTCSAYTGHTCINTFQGTSFCSNFTLYADSSKNPCMMLYLSFENVVFLNFTYTTFYPSVAPQEISPPNKYQCSNSNCSCPLVNTHTIHGVTLCNVGLIPSWIGAVIIGLVGAYLIYTKLGPTVTGHIGFAVPFFIYAFMISSGFVCHCVYLVECGKAAPSGGFFFWSELDASLTSTIAIAFLFAGLIDINILNEKSKWTWIALGVLGVLVFVCYEFNLLSFKILYVDVILVCCGSFVLLELYRMIKMGSAKGVAYALVAVLTGGVGLMCTTILLCYLCTVLGAWSPETLWYLASDISMVFILLFVLASHRPSLFIGAFMLPKHTPEKASPMKNMKEFEKVSQASIYVDTSLDTKLIAF